MANCLSVQIWKTVHFRRTLKQNRAAQTVKWMPRLTLTLSPGICKLMLVPLMGQWKLGKCASSDIYWHFLSWFLNSKEQQTLWLFLSLFKSPQFLIVQYSFTQTHNLKAASVNVLISTITTGNVNSVPCRNKPELCSFTFQLTVSVLWPTTSLF